MLLHADAQTSKRPVTSLLAYLVPFGSSALVTSTPTLNPEQANLGVDSDELEQVLPYR